MTDTAELRRLLAGATPGPWHASDRGVGWEVHVLPHPESCWARLPDGSWPLDASITHGPKDTLYGADAALIAAARNALPALLDELEQLRRYAGLIDVVRSAEEAGLVVHVAYRATCAEHIEVGDGAGTSAPTPRAEGGQG